MAKKKDRRRDTGAAPHTTGREGKDGRPRGKAKGEPRSFKRTVIEYAKAIGTALVIALVLRQFLFQAFRIPTGSMLDTLQVGDYLFVNKFLYGAKTPDRIRILNWTIVDGLPYFKFPAIRQPRQGDIIVFEYPRDRNLDYIKRCVAVAGDTVVVREGVLYVNGEIYESNFGDLDGDHSCIPNWTDPGNCPEPHVRKDRDPYADSGRYDPKYNWPAGPDGRPYVVPAGHIFMMGDNRYNSQDSRYWGALDVNLVRGKAMFIYFSVRGEFPWIRFERIGDIIR